MWYNLTMDMLMMFHKVMNKPRILFVFPFVYLLLIYIAKWHFGFSLQIALFFVGGVVGMFILDVAEQLFQVNPSPFRTTVFIAALSIVTIYTITSTQELLADGLVLTLTLTLFLYQVSEWKIQRSLQSWYSMLLGTVSPNVQKVGLGIFGIVFFLETILFIVS